MKRLFKRAYYRIRNFYKNARRIYIYISLIHLHKKQKNKINNESKVVIFYFDDRSLIASGFAYYYSLIIGFIKNDFIVILDLSWKDSKLINDQNRILFLTNGLLLRKLKNNSSKAAIVISDNQNFTIVKHKRLIVYDPNILNKEINEESEIVQPFSIHPHKFAHDLPQRQGERSIKVFFSGNCDESYYNKPSPWNLMNRYEVISFIKENFKDIILNTIPLTGSDNKEFPLLVQDWSWNHYNGGFNVEFRVPNEKWLEFLLNTNFFVSPPGVNIPFSHNIIEAMLVGSIPITNYGHLFFPPLVNNVNCLSFSNKEELLKAINKGLKMDLNQVNNMRRNVKDYYTKFLDPKVFVSKVVVNTELKKIYYYATNLTEKKFRTKNELPSG